MIFFNRFTSPSEALYSSSSFCIDSATFGNGLHENKFQKHQLIQENPIAHGTQVQFTLVLQGACLAGAKKQVIHNHLPL
jgi:hypothetical protein